MLSDVTNLTKVTLDEGDVLVVNIDIQGMHSEVADDYMKRIKDYLSVYFFSNQIVVLPGQVRLSIINPTAQKNNGTSISES